MKGATVLYLKNQQGSLRMFDKDDKVVYQVPTGGSDSITPSE
jgi:hypothetical protein